MDESIRKTYERLLEIIKNDEYDSFELKVTVDGASVKVGYDLKNQCIK